MKRLVTNIIIFTIMGINCYAQNQAPIAINDTIFVEFNDSINHVEPSSTIIAYSNDSDPDGDNIFIDTAYYNGTAQFSFETLIVTPSTSFVRIIYQPPLDFWGIDVIQYVLKDDGIPVMYDTANIYVFVKRKTFEELNLNNINARIGLQSLFYDETTTSAAFEVPKGSGIHSIYAANLWVGGMNQGLEHVNGSTFDFLTVSHSLIVSLDKSGPIMNNAYYKNYYDYDWDRVWKVNHSDIIYHRDNWNNGGYYPPQVFIDWPAHGDPAKGQAVNLAPFVDNDGDGIYDPFAGDYPKIKGQQAIYFIYNDVRLKDYQLNRTQTEVHGMAYAFECPFDSAMNNTVFLDYTVYNRSNNIYTNTYAGFWADIDIGNNADDYVACDVNRSSFFNYNGDDNDELNSGINGYGTYIPAQSITFLKGVKQDGDGIDNAFGIGSNESINGFGYGDGIIDNEYLGMEYFSFYNQNDILHNPPVITSDFYNYLSGKWPDGTSMVYGGDGHVTGGGTIPAKYVFPDSSDTFSYGTGGVPQAPWEDFGSFDKRSVGSSGPFTFYPDSSFEITLAFIFGRNYQVTGRKAGIDLMKQRVDTMRSYFFSDYISTCYVEPVVVIEEPIIPPNNSAHVPSAFSPNGDGNNDLLYVYGGPYPEMSFSIYDRWGEIVFHTTHQDVGWNGTFRGKKVESGVYVYLLIVEFYDGESINEGGNITLVR